jgi:hypothetical protein
VLQGTTHDTVRAEIGYGEKVSQRLWSKKLEEGIGLTAGHKDAQRLEGRRVFELERVVSCRRADPWWRTKLHFSSGEPFDDLHRSTALTRSRTIFWRSMTLSVSAALRKRARNAARVSARRRECGAIIGAVSDRLQLSTECLLAMT